MDVLNLVSLVLSHAVAVGWWRTVKVVRGQWVRNKLGMIVDQLRKGNMGHILSTNLNTTRCPQESIVSMRLLKLKKVKLVSMNCNFVTLNMYQCI